MPFMPNMARSPPALVSGMLGFNRFAGPGIHMLATGKTTRLAEEPIRRRKR